MTKFNSQEKQYFEKLFDMSSGYVLDFSNSTLREFILGSVGVDIYDSKYDFEGDSKANRLRAFWNIEANKLIGKLNSDILKYMRLTIGLSEEQRDLWDFCKDISDRLLGLESPELLEDRAANQIFISYQTHDKKLAGKIKDLLNPLEIDCFLAHEDIEVSDEWRERILVELHNRDIFICLLSTHYYESPWCVQESGIAAFRNIAIIPLSLDGSVPRGFIEIKQSVRIPTTYYDLLDLLAPGFVKHDQTWAINMFIEKLRVSETFRQAEANLRRISPYIDKISNEQGVQILRYSIRNDQIHHAFDCATKLLPPFLKKFGDMLDPFDKDFLSEKVEEYSH